MQDAVIDSEKNLSGSHALQTTRADKLGEGPERQHERRRGGGDHVPQVLRDLVPKGSGTSMENETLLHAHAVSILQRS